MFPTIAIVASQNGSLIFSARRLMERPPPRQKQKHRGSSNSTARMISKPFIATMSLIAPIRKQYTGSKLDQPEYINHLSCLFFSFRPTRIQKAMMIPQKRSEACHIYLSKNTINSTPKASGTRTIIAAATLKKDTITPIF